MGEGIGGSEERASEIVEIRSSKGDDRRSEGQVFCSCTEMGALF